MKTVISVILMILMNFFNVNYQETSDPVTEWLQANGCKIEVLELIDAQQDFQILDKIVGEAKVVCLGESRHDAREQFLLKHRLIKYLVEEMGFNTFVLEASFPYAEQINNFILHDEGNLEEIMADMPGWFIWDTEEMQYIIEWMREYNSNPENLEKISFFGIDIVAPDYGLTEIFNYIRELDRDTYESLQNRSFGREFIDDGFWPNTRREYAGLTNEQKQILAINYGELYSILQANEAEYIYKSSMAEYAWILQLAYCVKMANEMFSAESRIDMGLTRDQTMAENVFWLKEQFPESKMIVWAHNVHIAMSEFTMSLEEYSIKGMGSIMKDELGDDMVSIGAAFNQGYFAEEQRTLPAAGSNTIDATLSLTGFEYAIFDLHGESEDEDVKEWLNTPRIMQAQDFEITCIPSKSFDAFYFTESISKTRLNQSSAARLRNMR